jgi:hypothetical protein
MFWMNACPGDDDSGSVIRFQAAHRPQARFSCP